MINKGIVTKIKGNKISVRLYKSSACSHCSACSEEAKSGKIFDFPFDKEVEKGDLVTLEIAEKEVMKAAIIVYVIPPIFMILGYIVAASLNFSETMSALGSFVGLAVSFLILFLYDKFFAKKNIEEEIKIIAVEKYDPNNLEFDISCAEF